MAESANPGTGKEIRVRELVEVIARLTGFTGAFHSDQTKRDRRRRWVLDISRAQRLHGFSRGDPTGSWLGRGPGLTKEDTRRLMHPKARQPVHFHRG